MKKPHSSAKEMHATYNHLNMPVPVDFGSNNKIEYLYTATGARIKTTVYTNGTITKEMHYAANIVSLNCQMETSDIPPNV